MQNRTELSVGRAALSGLLLVAAALAAGGCAERAMGDCAGAERYDDVALAQGLGLCSTAGEEEQALIRALLDRGPRAAEPAGLTVDYPIEGSIVPPDIVAPTFLWHDDSEEADRWLVDVAFSGGSSHLYVLVPGMPPPQGEIDPQCITITNEIYKPTPYQASAVAWRPADLLWEAIKKNSVEEPANITFYGYRADEPDRIFSRGATTLTTSADPVGAPIFYRDVPLMPSATTEGVIKPLDKHAQPLIAWRLKEVGRRDSQLLLKDMPTCANCHSFSRDGSTLGMDIDGPDGDKGAYAFVKLQPDTRIDDEQIITWNSLEGKPKGHHTLGFLSRVSPDARYVVSTVNEALYVTNFYDHRFIQVFFPTRGILAYYSRESGEIKLLPGADDPDYVHCNAVWTPDGETLIFARAKARSPYERGRPVAEYAGDPNETRLQYDLYRMPFNEGRGGVPVPIEGASNNGMSNSFPKVSPDGKWLVFVKAENGLLMRPDGRLWMVPLDGGEAREMNCNTPLMNSWHSFSPNGRWMVFSSKANTPYTQMFLTHIDENGIDSPPILIEGSTAANRAVNLPEFVDVPYDDFRTITVPAVFHYENFGLGNELARQGRHLEAIAEFEKALEGERDWSINDWMIHDSISKSLLQVGRLDEALEHIDESLRINPYNPGMLANKGLILSMRGDIEGALTHLDAATDLYPGDPRPWYNRGMILLSQGDFAGAQDNFSEAIRLEPLYVEAYTGRGMVRRETGELAGAIADFDEAIRINPKDPAPLYFRGLVRGMQGDLAGAEADFLRGLEVAPPGSRERAEIEKAYRQVLAAKART
jgi:Flp pilus assembly protein TadD